MEASIEFRNDFDDLLHERHGEYELQGKSMGDLTSEEYGAVANAFINSMLENGTEVSP